MKVRNNSHLICCMSLPWLHVYIIINLYNYYIINYGYSSSVDFGNFKIYLLSNFVVCAPLNPTLYNARCAGRKFMRKNKSAEKAVPCTAAIYLPHTECSLSAAFISTAV